MLVFMHSCNYSALFAIIIIIRSSGCDFGDDL